MYINVKIFLVNFNKAWHRKVDYQLSESSSTEVDSFAKKKKYQQFNEESSDEGGYFIYLFIIYK